MNNIQMNSSRCYNQTWFQWIVAFHLAFLSPVVVATISPLAGWTCQLSWPIPIVKKHTKSVSTKKAYHFYIIFPEQYLISCANDINVESAPLFYFYNIEIKHDKTFAPTEIELMAINHVWLFLNTSKHLLRLHVLQQTIWLSSIILLYIVYHAFAQTNITLIFIFWFLSHIYINFILGL